MKEKKPHTTISNCQFTGVKWEGKSLEAVNDIAKALLNLTEVLRGQEVKIDAMLKIGDTGK